MADLSRVEKANIIREQLGGARFAAMTGASHFTATDEGLGFKIPRAKDGINYVFVEVTDLDLYTVKFCRYRGLKLTTLVESHQVYADMLRATFTRNTGLEVSL